MDDSPFQFAKRETQSSFAAKPVWAGLVAAGAILGVAGPFGTDDVLRLIPRLVYWLALTIGFFFTGSFVATYLGMLLTKARLPLWPAYALAGGGAGGVIFALLMGINIALFDVSLDCIQCLLVLAANVVGISMIVTLASVYITQALQSDETKTLASDTAPGNVTPAVPSILKRLPMEKRGALLSLSVDDHYVEVVTSNGRELLLMRLSDAMNEVGDTPGLQVHRSHWVALAAITSARREGAKAILTLQDGREIPASRTYVPALKEAGILPG